MNFRGTNIIILKMKEHKTLQYSPVSQFWSGPNPWPGPQAENMKLIYSSLFPP